MRFFAKIHDGKMVFDFPDLVERFLRDVRQSYDGKITCDIRKVRKERSLNQNNYYFGCIVAPLADFLGYQVEDMHEILKTLFLREHNMQEVAGKTIDFQRVKSTTELSTVEAEKYYETIRRWAAQELSFSIPEPNETDE